MLSGLRGEESRDKYEGWSRWSPSHRRSRDRFRNGRGRGKYHCSSGSVAGQTNAERGRSDLAYFRGTDKNRTKRSSYLTSDGNTANWPVLISWSVSHAQTGFATLCGWIWGMVWGRMWSAGCKTHIMIQARPVHKHTATEWSNGGYRPTSVLYTRLTPPNPLVPFAPLSAKQVQPLRKLNLLLSCPTTYIVSSLSRAQRTPKPGEATSLNMQAESRVCLTASDGTIIIVQTKVAGKLQPAFCFAFHYSSTFP